jgi:hypothetical protein
LSQTFSDTSSIAGAQRTRGLEHRIAMPELPEVETVANGVDARVRGQRIMRVWTSGKPQTFKSSEEEIVEILTGARIERVRRVGKTIVMDLGSGGASVKKQIPSGNDTKTKSGSITPLRMTRR